MKTVFKPCILLVCSLMYSLTAVSQVSTISGDNLVQYGKQQAYWEADVTCSDNSERVVQRKTDGDEWCGKAIEGFCEPVKENAAQKVCAAEYTSALAAREEARQARNRAVEAQRARQAELQREEQRRLADQRIEQQRLEREKRAAAAPQEKRINIEEELIRIEQEKLDLRRQELELQRRAVEIQELLDENA